MTDKYQYPPPLPVRLKLREAAKQMRNHPTPAEQKLWVELKGKQLSNHKFRRQFIIGWFIVDFCCVEKQLVIEVDGGIHETQQAQDATRTSYLESQGYRVIRFKNEQITHDMTTVIDVISQVLTP